MNKSKFILLISLLILSVIAYFFIFKGNLLNDEVVHFAQIDNITNGNFKQLDAITNILGYHYTIAALCFLTGFKSIIGARFFSYIISLICIVLFYFTAYNINKNQASKKYLEFISFPILTVFFYMIYTDVNALLFLILSLFFYSKKQFAISILAISISILVRQTYIVYVTFMYCSIILESCNFDFKKIFYSIKENKSASIIFGLTTLGFILFVILNHGIAMGDKSNHDISQFRPANIYFCLNLFFLFNFFYIVSQFNEIINLIKSKWKLILPLFIIYCFIVNKTYIIDHMFNERWTLDGFIRMRFLYFYLDTIVGKSILILTSFTSILYLICTVKIYSKSSLLLLFTLLYLLPIWLVEQRYYLPFFLLYIMFKKEESKTASYLQISLNAIFTIIILYSIYTDKFFL